MEVSAGIMVPVGEASQAGEARRAASSMAANSGFDDDRAGRLALVVTEAATNLVKHAHGGEIHLRLDGGTGRPAIDVVALDRGPGMSDPDACMRDGFTTGATPGTGLGAIRRMSSRFDVYSDANGTALLSTVSGQDVNRAALEVGTMSVPFPGETVSGDSWGVRAATLLVVDGLGHGPRACEAARAAVESFEANPGDAPAEALERMHARMHGTRGAAAAVARIDSVAGVVTFAGLGNIAGAVCTSQGARNMVSHHGTLGHDARRFQEFRYEWAEDAVLVMHSDGITSRWDLARYPGLLRRHPMLVAAVLYRDFRRERDDVTVLVARSPR